MKILFYLTRYPGIGGIENVTNIIASHLRENNDIFIISHIQCFDIKPLDGIKLFFMPNSENWEAKENMQYVQKIMRTNSFDAIIYQDSYAPTDKIVCNLSKTYKVPLYVFEHNSPLFVYNKRSLDSVFTIKGFLRRFLHPYILYKEIKRKRNLLSHAKRYVLLSQYFVPEFCKLINANNNDKRITYINNPITLLKEDLNIKKENIILCVSRLAREKYIDKMLDIWKVLSHELPDWRFIIVGDGPEREKLEAIVHKNKLSRISFTGYAQPAPYYQKAKIFWMTSKFEGWGMTLIEAMQRKCVPVVFQTFSSVKDIISSGSNGFLINPYNNQDFLNKTLELANNENKYIYMAKNAAQSIQKFSIDKIVSQWEDLLKQ